MKTKVAITQMSCSSNYEENIRKADEMVKKCAEAGAQIILLQELFENLYFCQIEDYDKFDYIIIMDEINKYNLTRIIKEDKDNKVHKLLDFTPNPKEIEDPWYSGNFEKVYKEIDNGCRCFLEYLKTKIKD